MATKVKSKKSWQIISSLNEGDFITAFRGCFSDISCTLIVEVEDKFDSSIEFRLSIIGLRHESLLGNIYSFEGISGDGTRYRGRYNFDNYEDCRLAIML